MTKTGNLANGIVGHLISRNNDIGGYWGIGILASPMFGTDRKIIKSIKKYDKNVIIQGHSMTHLHELINKNSAEYNCISIIINIRESGRYFDNKKKEYFVNVTAIISHNQKNVIYCGETSCWLHDPTLESRRLRRRG